MCTKSTVVNTVQKKGRFDQLSRKAPGTSTFRAVSSAPSLRCNSTPGVALMACPLVESAMSPGRLAAERRAVLVKNLRPPALISLVAIRSFMIRMQQKVPMPWRPLDRRSKFSNPLSGCREDCVGKRRHNARRGQPGSQRCASHGQDKLKHFLRLRPMNAATTLGVCDGFICCGDWQS